MKRILYNTLDSTQTEARLLLQSQDLPFVVMTPHQTAGYGKYGRTWHSEAGNFSATFAIRHVPENYSFGKVPMVISIEICRIIEDMITHHGQVAIKWPNDILLNQRKICGVLIERHDDTLLVGIGINLRWSPNSTDVAYPTTNILAETGVLIQPEVMLDQLAASFEHFDAALKQIDAANLRQTYLTRLNGKGQTITAVTRTHTYVGVLQDINTDGALIMNIDGAQQLIYAADIYTGV